MEAPLTPVEERNGRWYKREDLYRHPSGVNGGKWRSCQWLVSRMRGDVIVTGASVLSPQHAMTAVAAAEAGKRSIHVVGGTTVEKALHHPSPRLAAEWGAHFRAIRVGYNTNIQPEVQRVAQALVAEIMPYGITTQEPSDIAEFHRLNAAQVANLPPRLRSLIVPFGSGNSGTSILLGLLRHPLPPAEVHMVGIGPDRRVWLRERLRKIGWRGLPGTRFVFYQTGIPYSSRVRYTADGIALHPTYEGKVARWADETGPPGWAERDGTCAFWIVGGAL